MYRRQFIQFFASLGAAAGFAFAPALAQDKPIRIGVTGGVHAEIMEQVKKLAEKEGLKLRIVEFSDYIQPNAALAAGDLDANSYQHQPYLDAQIKDRGYKLVSIGSTITFPMAVYSKKIKSLEELQNGARIGVPNDPSNGGRALLLLQTQGLIRLKPAAGLTATPLDIVDNPKKLRIVELDAAQLPRALHDFDAAVINDNFANSAGLSPTRDGIAMEAIDGPYVNIIAVRAEDRNKPWVTRLLKVYRSPEIKKFVQQRYGDAAMTSW
ncbi:MAG TPA: MetQ/NlpA family ABC transporter substrate-binding protein [Herbaspirillum sp.]|nr:MetQ/NlpA family ABC transporter substrate-binding protein [Herbaspirillum sp.]